MKDRYLLVGRRRLRNARLGGSGDGADETPTGSRRNRKAVRILTDQPALPHC
jgi:hypothetical protein